MQSAHVELVLLDLLQQDLLLGLAHAGGDDRLAGLGLTKGALQARAGRAAIEPAHADAAGCGRDAAWRGMAARRTHRLGLCLPLLV